MHINETLDIVVKRLSTQHPTHKFSYIDRASDQPPSYHLFGSGKSVYMVLDGKQQDVIISQWLIEDLNYILGPTQAIEEIIEVINYECFERNKHQDGSVNGEHIGL